MILSRAAAGLSLALLAAAGVRAQDSEPPVVSPVEPPVIPVGLDAYRRWDLWAHQRIGARAYMRTKRDKMGHILNGV